MNKLLTFAKSIEDFRMNRKKLHPAENIVFITILAIICDAMNWEEIAEFGEARKEYLSKYLDLSNGIPSHDTFNRFFSLYSPPKFQTLFLEWLHELLEIKVRGQNQIAIDGKSNKGTGTVNSKMIHILSAYLVDQQCILAQKKTSEKSNEITAIPMLLEVLNLKGAVVSIDAMGCQKEIAEKIIEREADYFLAVKQNQKTLHTDIESAFLVYPKTADNYFSTEEINGSRVEKRECMVMDDLTHLSEEYRWRGLKQIVKIETQSYLKSEGRTRNETRYYITSCEASAQRCLLLSRKHWTIENNLHWSLDVIFKEDSSRKRNNNVAENFSIMLKVILKLLKEKQPQVQVKHKKISIKRM